MKKSLKILITTGIYPPQIGGPAQYAKNLKESLEEIGHTVFISTYGMERHIPSGLRHIYFFCRIFSKFVRSDFCITLDTFSVGFPSVLAGKIFGKKVIVRTGGDFLWEGHVERTGKKILLRNFYNTEIQNFSLKEKMIFKLTKWTLKNSFTLVFSTDWQRDIWSVPYKLDHSKISIIENFYGSKIESSKPNQKIFLSGTRPLKWKNKDVLRQAWQIANQTNSELVLDNENVPYDLFMKKMKNCYAVVLVSLGDISPNMILDAIRYNKPFICTKETGLYEKLKDIGIFVDPTNPKEIAEKIIFLSKPENYEIYKKKVESFNFRHSSKEIALEFLDIYGKI